MHNGDVRMSHPNLFRVFAFTIVCVTFVACGPEPIGDLGGNPLIRSGNKTKTMKPASMTQEERLGKADGYDPRDGYAEYAFTADPFNIDDVPGEFESVQQLLVAWPQGAEDLASMFIEMIHAASESVPTVVFVDANSYATFLSDELEAQGADLSRIKFVKVPLDTIWIRDYGPIVAKLKDGSRVVVDPRYYYGRWTDDAFPTKLAKSWGMSVVRPPIETEGGNFQSDGDGNCIVTERILQQNAHFGYSSTDLKQIYREYFGCENTLILPELYGEGTGHVDMYATITGPRKVIVGKYKSSDDSINAARLDKAAALLKQAGFAVTRIPMPTNDDGSYRSYTNSIALNGLVLVPIYLDDRRFENDALQIFKTAYPGRTIVPIDATEIIQWAGAVHCITMTMGGT